MIPPWLGVLLISDHKRVKRTMTFVFVREDNVLFSFFLKSARLQQCVYTKIPAQCLKLLLQNKRYISPGSEPFLLCFKDGRLMSLLGISHKY